MTEETWHLFGTGRVAGESTDQLSERSPSAPVAVVGQVRITAITWKAIRGSAGHLFARQLLGLLVDNSDEHDRLAG